MGACGSDSGGDGPDVDAARAALTKSEIKIGVLVASTGTSSTADASAGPVAEAWADWVNTNGGLNGHPVTVVLKDTKSDSAAASAAAKELLSDSGVLAITMASANTEAPQAAVLGGKDVAVVGSTGYSPEVWGKLTNYFATGPQSGITNILAQFASSKAVGAKTWTGVVCAEVAACKASKAIYDVGTKQFGLTLGGAFEVSSTAPSYTAECLKIIGAKTDYMQLGIPPAAGSRLVADCDAQGYTEWIGATAGALNRTLTEIDGIRLAGGLNGFPWWADAPAAAEFRDAMKEFKPDADYENPGATAAWAGLQVIRAAMAKVGDSPTRADVFTGLYTLKDFDLGGLLSKKVTYTEGEPAPPLDCVWLYRYEDGKFGAAPLDGPSGNSVASGDLKSDCLALSS
ncbi:hypothetical protein CcI49_28870 [Frankia sp. CcI49]|nr:hypothetical protein CcI49_28870 [Frankia sp. CcI49]